MSIVKRLKEDARIVKYTHKYTANLMTEAADTITAYAKAFEDIRAEIEQIIGERNLDDYDFCSGLICARKIIDKHNPNKAGKENRNDTDWR